jgi:hypothetical protein
MTRLTPLLVILKALAFAGNASAQTPTPTDESTPAAVATFRLGFEAPLTYTWEAIETASELHISGSAVVLRTNAVDPLCSAPLEQDSRTVTIEATLAGDATSYTIPLPELPAGDAWFVAQDNVRLDALDGEMLIAQGEHNIIAETQCLRPTPTTTSLAEDGVIGNCRIPAGYRETTTQAARDRGQRVFTDPSGSHAIYVRRDGSCVSLAAIPPLPEFAPEGPLGVDDPQSARTSLGLPETGQRDAEPSRSILACLAALAGAMGVMGLAAALKH